MTVPVEEIEGNIRDMGYITATPRKEEYSYYKLKDGTIIKVLFRVNHVLVDPTSPQNFDVNFTNIVAVYVPKEKRKPGSFQLHASDTQSNEITEDDMEAVPLRENFSVYDLSNGRVLSVRTVAGQISKKRSYTKEGEPNYAVNTTPVIKIRKQD